MRTYLKLKRRRPRGSVRPSLHPSVPSTHIFVLSRKSITGNCNHICTELAVQTEYETQSLVQHACRGKFCRNVECSGDNYVPYNSSYACDAAVNRVFQKVILKKVAVSAKHCAG